MTRRRPDLDALAFLRASIDERVIYLTGEIDAKAYSRAAAALHLLERSGGESALTVQINSEGGDLAHGLALHDLLAACPRHVVTIGVGEVCSAAAVVFQAGDERVLGATASLMIHNGSGVFSGTPDEVSIATRAWKVQRTAMHRVLAARSGLTLAEVQRRCRGDTWLTATQAITLGLADRLL